MSNDQQLKDYRRLIGEACAKVKLADFYYEDGALLSSADNFEKAAVLLRQAHGLRVAWIEGSQ